MEGLTEPRIALVQPHQIDLWWDVLEPPLAKACEYSEGCYNTEVIKGAAKVGWKRTGKPDVYLYVIYREDPMEVLGVVAASNLIYPTGLNVLSVILTGGERRHEWLRVLDAYLMELARRLGATAVIFSGRRGWKTSLPDGWRPSSTNFIKEVPPSPSVSENNG